MRHASRTTSDEPALVDALRRVFEAGQQLVLDRFDLMRLDLTRAASWSVRGAILLGTGMLLLSGALAMLAAVAVTSLDRVMSLPAAILLVGGVTATLAVMAVMVGMQRTRVDTEFGMTRGEGRQ